MGPIQILAGLLSHPSTITRYSIFASACLFVSVSCLLPLQAAELELSDNPAIDDAANKKAEEGKPSFDEAIELVRSKEYTKAINAFERFAEMSQYDAQYNLALMLKKGIGRPQDYATALKWSWLAQLGGLKKAEYLTESLIDLLPEDAIIDIKMQIAQRLKEHAEGGNAEAIMQYAHFNMTFAEPIDFQEAYTWFSIASAMQIKGGIKMRDEVAEEIDEELLLELQEASKSIYASIQLRLNPPPPPEPEATKDRLSNKFRSLKTQTAK
jgi:tetratricopeptide (TPR) repeat protein